MKKNKINFKGGFTLIELLVVIAIIGILSSVVLASLNGARTKAKIAAVQSTLSSMRAQAELGVDTNGRYIPDTCASSATGGLKTLINSLNTTQSKITALKCGVDAGGTTSTDYVRKWAVEAQIDSKWYCTDSSGYNGLSKLTSGTTTTNDSTTDGSNIGTPATSTAAFIPSINGAITTGTSKTNLDCAK